MQNIYRVLLGGIEITNAVQRLSYSQAISAQPSANMELLPAKLMSAAVDFSAQLSILEKRTGAPQFSGEIVHARLRDSVVVVEATGGLQLNDRKIARLTTFGLPATEAIRLLAYDAGIVGDQLRVEVPDSVQHQYFEVIFPVEGAITQTRHYVSSVAFLPREVVATMCNKLRHGPSSDLISDFISADSFIVVGAVDLHAADAELTALRRAEEVVAWMAVDARTTSVFGPEFRVAAFYSRSDNLVVPRLKRMSFLRGALNGMGWIRDLESPTSHTPYLTNIYPKYGTLSIGPNAPVEIRLAAQSLYRSVAAQDVLEQNLALWDAVEFYASNVKGQKLFRPKELKALRQAVANAGVSWSVDQTTRLEGARASLNAMPLLMKLRTRLRADRIPFTEQEFQALARLRASRNDSVHGRREVARGTTKADLRASTQMLARALTYSSAKNGPAFRSILDS